MPMQRIKHVRQVPGEPFRQWYAGPESDLIVWYSDSLTIQGFQFCYRLGKAEKAFTWMEGRGFSHHAVDNGELFYAPQKQTPILYGSEKVNASQVRKRFNRDAKNIRTTIVRLVNEKLNDYKVD